MNAVHFSYFNFKFAMEAMLSLFQTDKISYIWTNEMLMKVNKIILLVQLIDHIHEGNVIINHFSYFVKDSNQNLDRASGVQNRNQDVKEQFSKMKFKNCPTLNLMMFFKVLGSSRFSFEALFASLTLTSFLSRSRWLRIASMSIFFD